MKSRSPSMRLATTVIIVPIMIAVFNMMGESLCEMWFYNVVRFMQGSGGVAQGKLQAYRAVRYSFLIAGALAGIVASREVYSYILWNAFSQATGEQKS